MIGSISTISLPDGFYFLQAGWWVVHILAISTAVLIGYLIGSSRRTRREREARGEASYNMVEIPQAYRFLNRGWWVIHLIAIPLVFILGHILWPI